MLDNVLFINSKEEALKKLMSRLEVRVTTDQEVGEARRVSGITVLAAPGLGIACSVPARRGRVARIAVQGEGGQVRFQERLDVRRRARPRSLGTIPRVDRSSSRIGPLRTSSMSRSRRAM